MKRIFLRCFKSVKCGMRRLLYVVYLRLGVYIKHSDARYLWVFRRAVNRKIIQLGLENSKFPVPSGASASENYSTGRDMVQIMISALKYSLLQTALGTKTKEIDVKGKDSRRMIIEHTVAACCMDNSFPIIASKTGSWGTDWFNLAVVTQVDNQRVIGVVIGAATNEDRYAAMKELICCADHQAEGAVTKAHVAIAAVLQDDGNYEVLYEQNADEKCNPASLTKMITAMVVLDHIDDLKETLTYKYVDMCRRTGFINPGDVLTVEDAVYDMLLPSSNQSAQALARFTGRKILEKKT